MRVAFGDCTVDSETREVFRRGLTVHLSPKAFRLLELLLEGRPRAFSKAEIHQRIWPEAFVSEATLASLIAEIREAIGDGKDAGLIRTVHGFGYSFAGTATDAPRETPAGTVSCWRLIWDGREIPLQEGETIVGRDHLAGIRIPSESISRRHARIVVAQNAATIEDLGSKNGTWLRGEKIGEPRALQEGDSIRFGSITLTLRVISGEGSTATEIEPSPAREAASPTPPRRGKKRGTP